MRLTSGEIKTNALVLLAALGLAALYGGATALALFTLGEPEAMEIGGLVFRITGGLALAVATAMVLYVTPTQTPRRPMSRLEIGFFYLAGFFFIVLILPPTVITLGWAWRWLTGKTREEQHRP